MEHFEFSWDSGKDRINKRKHGVSFAEAQTVFYDENARLIDDPDHSKNEDRFIILGMSSNLRMMVVCHCYAVKDSVIRIISARKATKKEIKEYEEHLS